MWLIVCEIAFLSACTVFDLLSKKIPMVLVIAGIIVAALIRIIGRQPGITLYDVVIALIPGISFWILSFLSGEKVGYGDGWLLIMIGVYSGFQQCFIILLLSMILESTAVVILLSIKKIERNTEMAFAPFLLAGMVIVTCH